MTCTTYSSKTGLSKSWKVYKSHEGIYTGGKVSFLRGDDWCEDVQENSSLLACMFQNDVAFVNATSGHLLRTLQKGVDEEQRESIVVFAIRHGKKQIVTAGRNLLLRLWGLDDFKCIRSIKAHDTPVLAMDFDPSGALLATGGSDKSVRVFDIVKAYCTHHFRQHTGIVTLVRFHPDPKVLQLFSCSDDTTIRVFDLYSQTQVACIDDHMSIPTCLDVSLDGYTLFTVGRDKVLQIWDLRRQELKQTIVSNEIIEGLVVLPQDLKRIKKYRKANKSSAIAGANYFATVGEQGILKLWQHHDQKCTVIYEQDKDVNAQVMTQLILHSQRRELIAATTDHNLVFYDEKLRRSRLIVGYNDDILCLKYVPKKDGSLSNLFVAATNSAQLRIYNRDTLSCELLPGQKDIIMDLAVSPDGRWLTSASKDRTAKVWDLSTRKCVATCSGHSEALTAIAISQRSNQYSIGAAFFVTGSSDKTIKMWTLNSLRSMYDTEKDKGTGETIQCTALATVKAHERDVNALAISPNDRFIASASQDRLIKIWSARGHDGSLLTLKGICRGHKRGVWSIEFSPVDQCLASASGDKTIKLWSIKDFTCLKTFEGHTASVLAVQFTCAGMQLFSSGADGLVKLWTIKSSECEGTFDNHLDRIWALDVAKDSSEMISGGADSTIHIWKDHTQEEESAIENDRQTQLLKEQELFNCLRSNKLHRAVEIAFDLGHPHRLYKILSDLIQGSQNMDHPQQFQDSETNTFTPEKLLIPILDKLNPLQMQKLIGWIQEWNTNTKFSSVAQILLSSILQTVSNEKLKEMDHIDSSLDALIAYSERHYQRIDRLIEKSYLIDFNVMTMKNMYPQQLPGKVNSSLDTKRVHSATGTIFEPLAKCKKLRV